jgi:hypothetical protein
MNTDHTTHLIDELELQAIVTTDSDLLEAIEVVSEELDPYNEDDYADEEDYKEAFTSFVEAEYKANKQHTAAMTPEQRAHHAMMTQLINNYDYSDDDSD